MLNRERIQTMKQIYKKGMEIELIRIEGEGQMKQGLRGSVIAVDDIGQIHVNWENGSALALNVETDNFITAKEPERIQEGEEQKFHGMQME